MHSYERNLCNIVWMVVNYVRIESKNKNKYKSMNDSFHKYRKILQNQRKVKIPYNKTLLNIIKLYYQGKHPYLY